MKTEIIPSTSPDAIPQALNTLNSGGIVAFPTDTVYGVGVSAFDDNAVRSIYKAKDRPVEKAIPILIAEHSDLEKVGMDIPQTAYKLSARFWPGPLTCVIFKNNSLPESVSATSTVGVRIPDHEMARMLLRAAGPMAVTSANLSGQSSLTNADDVYAQLSGRIPLIIDGGETPGGIPSTVVDCSTEEIKILRKGPVSLQQLLDAS